MSARLSHGLPRCLAKRHSGSDIKLTSEWMEEVKRLALPDEVGAYPVRLGV